MEDGVRLGVDLRFLRDTIFSKSIELNKMYLVLDRNLNGPVFTSKFGLTRKYRSPFQFLKKLLSSGLRFVDRSTYERHPIGPAMPSMFLTDVESRLQNVRKLKHNHLIREAFCAHFSGKGYEIGAGRKPTIIPEHCEVRYVDKFTFEEAADGSWIGYNSTDGFVDVDHFEAMDDLSSIPDKSADFFIACHVIEHVPDVIGAILKVCQKLKPGKELFLVVPNKEFTFDKLRNLTPLKHFIDDFESDNVPMLEHYQEYSRLCKHEENWEQAGRHMMEHGSDFHVHVFAPENMENLLGYLKENGKIEDFSVRIPKHAERLVEFYATVKSG